MKIDYSVLSFRERCKATMDGLDGWSRGCACMEMVNMKTILVSEVIF